ncbi:MAG: replicative DNA helicase [Coxiellaceae bacterium]|jgi:replicative DNA helicase|nr:replicative DNA helicase [Coxiellaceae bacterium]
MSREKQVKSKYTKTEELKIPPHSIEAEQSVLGGLILDNTSWDKVSGLICEQDFYRPNHRLIFRAIEDLGRRNQPFDVLTLAESLKVISELENAGGEIYLFELAKNTPTVTNISAYAEIVRERSILRQLIEISREIADSAFNPEGRETKEILDCAESKIFKIAEQRARGQGPVDINTLLTKTTERIDTLYHSNGPITGVSTGFTDLDDMTSGLQQGDFVIVAGRPSMGKTALAMNIVEHTVIKGKKPVLVFSMEMPGESLAMRMISSLGHIDQHKVRTGKLHDEDWPRLTSAVSMLSEVPLYIDDTPSMSPAELRARARRVTRINKQIGLIVIDYLQLMHIPGFREGRVAEITEISRNLKALAKELDVPVLALSQLNRSLEQRIDKRPQMSDLRESGAIEQDADVIVFIYRDEVYHEDTPDKGIAEIIIAKQRNGPIGKVKLTFLGQYTRFENFAAVNYVG